MQLIEMRHEDLVKKLVHRSYLCSEVHCSACISVLWIKIQHKDPEKKLVSIQVTAAVEHSEVLCSAV